VLLETCFVGRHSWIVERVNAQVNLWTSLLSTFVCGRSLLQCKMKTSLERYLKILLKRWIVRNSNARKYSIFLKTNFKQLHNSVVLTTLFLGPKQYSWTLSLIKDLTVIILLVTVIIVVFMQTITYKIPNAKWKGISINQTAFYVPRKPYVFVYL